MADEVVRPQRDASGDGFGNDPAIVPQPQVNVDTGQDPTIQRFDDGSSIQTFDDGSVLATGTDGSISSLPGLTGQVQRTQASATAQDAQNANLSVDWRVRLSLAPGANYLYKAAKPGILSPLSETNGVIFPYTPTINVTYAAQYDPTDLTHSNYKIFQYKNSSVDSITIACEFTAQDTTEANYLLAVIHFFRSVTKMFYGQDSNPKNGTPPPLCYLTGLGQFQFNDHPLVINNFSYNLPNDVDYIRATSFPGTSPGVNTRTPTALNSDDPSAQRAFTSQVPVGGVRGATSFRQPGSRSSGTKDPTYVPTKILLTITAHPIVTRNDISNNFSLAKYASGELLNRASGGGIW